MKSFRLFSIFAALVLLTSLGACATAPGTQADYDEASDPLESANRVIFDFNHFVDRILLRPAAWVYREVMPDFAQDVVHNILQNSNEPIVFMNAVLQGRVKDAGKTFNRFLVNSIAGLGGVADLASEGGVLPVDADFGQTLHVWGLPEGPYLVLPILGPSNPRDVVGFAVDTIASPWSYVVEATGGVETRNHYIIADLTATMLDKRSRSIDALDALEKSSVDFYAQLRSVSRQYRHKQIGMTVQNSDIGKITFDRKEEEGQSAAPATEGAQPLRK
ncbi:MAG: VacJ family lipoprotein [Proteobacteria bacterium]|nr:VacJ family lipoprotein [Pseudomonadota bacterium]